MAFPAMAGLMGGLGALSTLTGGLQQSKLEKGSIDRLQSAANRQGAAAAEMKNAQRRSSAISRARGLSGVQEQFAQHEAARQFAPAIAAEANAANQQLIRSGERETGRTQNVLGGLGNALGGMAAQLGLQEPTSQPGTNVQDNVLGGLTGLMGTMTGKGGGGTNPVSGLENATESALSAIGLPAGATPAVDPSAVLGLAGGGQPAASQGFDQVVAGAEVAPSPSLESPGMEEIIAQMRAQGMTEEQIAMALGQ